MFNLLVAVLALLIDRVFGEFPFRHPVVYIGDLVKFFEEKFYKDSIFRGFVLVVFVLGIVWIISYIIVDYLSLLPYWISVVLSAFVASCFISYKMLKDEVLKVANISDLEKKREELSKLVSRDTNDLNESDINKALVETYAENLSDGVVAPLFYLLLFGLQGIILYKAINTLDSMVGYRNKKYEKFGKAAAKLDDLLNFLPSRITAILIMLFAKKRDIFSFYRYGKLHESPNAGHPISAMALSLGVRLGGDTSYFGKIKDKPYFGEGRDKIEKEDVLRAIKVTWK